MYPFSTLISADIKAAAVVHGPNNLTTTLRFMIPLPQNDNVDTAQVFVICLYY